MANNMTLRLILLIIHDHLSSTNNVVHLIATLRTFANQKGWVFNCLGKYLLTSSFLFFMNFLHCSFAEVFFGLNLAIIYILESAETKKKYNAIGFKSASLEVVTS